MNTFCEKAKKITFLIAGAFVCTGSLSIPANADEVSTGDFYPLDPIRFDISLGIGMANVNPEKAQQNNFSDSGFSASISTTTVIYDVLRISGAMNIAQPRDSASFSQTVEPIGPGSTSVEDSSLGVNVYALALGLRTPMLSLSPIAHEQRLEGFAGTLFADFGYAWIVGHRSISDCIDCRSDDITLNDGFFMRGGINLGYIHRSPDPLDMDFMLTPTYTRYLGAADVIDEFHVAFSLGFL